MSTYQFEYLDIEEATTPKDGHVVYADRWWVVNPTSTAITFFRPHGSRYRAPQCNHDERLVRELVPRLYPDHNTMFIPVVYLSRQDS